MRTLRIIRWTLLAIATATLLTTGVARAWAQGGGPANTEAKTATAQKLARAITIELTEARLEDVFQFLRDFTGAEIDAMWTDDRSADGLDKDQRITISVKDIAVLDFIERVLAKSKTDLSPSTWQFSSSGGVEVGPRSRLNKNAYLKLYDINDLLFEIPNFDNAPSLDLDQVLNQGQQGGGGGGGGIFNEQNRGQRPVTPPASELGQRLITLITESVEPEQWQDNGGDGGTIRFFNGYLLIRAPDYLHRQLTGYRFSIDRGTRIAVPSETARPAAGGGNAPSAPSTPKKP